MSDAAVTFFDGDGEPALPRKEQEFAFKCPRRNYYCGNLIIAGRTNLKWDPQGNNGGVPQWNWDGNRSAPTFTPSIDCKRCWHGYIRGGRCVDTGGNDEAEIQKSPEGSSISSQITVGSAHSSNDHHPTQDGEGPHVILKEMSMTKINPTVGRIVWYGGDKYFKQHDQPLAAIVCCVNKGGTVNLAVFDSDGSTHHRQNVTLVQEGDKRPAGAFCMWMPYQLGQAAKTEQVQNAGRTPNGPIKPGPIDTSKGSTVGADDTGKDADETDEGDDEGQGSGA